MTRPPVADRLGAGICVPNNQEQVSEAERGTLSVTSACEANTIFASSLDCKRRQEEPESDSGCLLQIGWGSCRGPLQCEHRRSSGCHGVTVGSNFGVAMTMVFWSALALARRFSYHSGRGRSRRCCIRPTSRPARCLERGRGLRGRCRGYAPSWSTHRRSCGSVKWRVERCGLTSAG